MAKEPALPTVEPAVMDDALARALSGEPAALAALLGSHSNLPGPRGNLELAGQFAAAVAALAEGPHAQAAWRVTDELARVGCEEAPVGDPGEFLAFCGTLAAAGFAASRDYRPAVWGTICRAAEDPRWRLREAAAMAIQRTLPLDPDGIEMLDSWASAGSWLLCRAVVAGWADPPLLRRPGSPEAALRSHEVVMRRVAATTDRRSPEFRALRQGLGFTLSVVVAAVPDSGFAFLERLASTADADLAWIVRANLGKARLARAHPREVERVLLLLTS